MHTLCISLADWAFPNWICS